MKNSTENISTRMTKQSDIAIELNGYTLTYNDLNCNGIAISKANVEGQNTIENVNELSTIMNIVSKFRAHSSDIQITNSYDKISDNDMFLEEKSVKEDILLKKCRLLRLPFKKLVEWIHFNQNTFKIEFKNTIVVIDKAIGYSFYLWLGTIQNHGRVQFIESNAFVDNIDLKANSGEIFLPLWLLKEIVIGNKYESILNQFSGHLITYGECEFDAGNFRKFLKSKNIIWINYYGYPELFIVTVLSEIQYSNGKRTAHIGKPVVGNSACILGSTNDICPIKIPGQLFFHYKNEKFSNLVEMVINKSDDIIKTGYVAQWEDDGRISFHGRNDNTISYRGERVSLVEIEKFLFNSKLVFDCAVINEEDESIIQELKLYCVLTENSSGEKINEELTELIPEHLLPVNVINLKSIPRLHDGEVDKNYLKGLKYLDCNEIQNLKFKVQTIPQIKNALIYTDEVEYEDNVFHITEILPDNKLEKKYFNNNETKTELYKEKNDKKKNSIAMICNQDISEFSHLPDTLTDIFVTNVKKYADNNITYILENGMELVQTYSELQRDVDVVLSGLRNFGLKNGDKAILLTSNNIDFIKTFWGCVLGGIIPVPISVPKLIKEKNNESQTLFNIWNVLNKPTIITSKDLDESIEHLVSNYSFVRSDFLSVDKFNDFPPNNDYYCSKPEDTAIILFTSGSTGTPKGVIQTHRTLIARQSGTAKLNNFSSKDISLNWMPLEHVGGIVMFHLRDVFLGANQIQVETEYILRDPLRWIDLISRFEVTITWAPNFAYSLIVSKLKEKVDPDWKLHKVKFMLNGGEAINSQSSKLFLRLLSPFGLHGNVMHPAWGMSETCSGVIYSELFDKEDESGIHYLDKKSLSGHIKKLDLNDAGGVTFVELGLPIPGISIRIVDADGNCNEEAEIGKIQIKGSTVTPGYYNNPELNKESFTTDGWFDTGDLGFILNRRLTITGRSKDVIIINGNNYNNVEIEATVEELENVEVTYTAACALQDDIAGTEKMIIFFSSRLEEPNELNIQCENIRKHILKKFGQNPEYIIPLKKEEIPKTSIGKIQRSKLLSQFNDGFYSNKLKERDLLLKNERTIPEWIYSINWFPSIVLASPQQKNGGYYIIFKDDMGLAEKLAAYLKHYECTVILVEAGNEFKKITETSYIIDSSNSSNYKELIGSIDIRSSNHINVLHLWNYIYCKSNPSPQSLNQNIDKCFYSLVYLINVLRSMIDKMDVTIISSNSVSVNKNEKLDIEKSLLSGWVKSVKHEIPSVKFKQIDLEIKDNEKNSEYIINDLLCVKEKTETAWRNGQRYIPQLVKQNLFTQLEKKLPLKSNALYLISGGLGGIGRHIIKWLVHEFNAKLIIIGRTAFDMMGEDDKSERSKFLKELGAINAKFKYYSGDCSDPIFLRKIVDESEDEWSTCLSGIFHLAGNLERIDEFGKNREKYSISHLERKDYENGFSAKVYGTYYLHELIKNNPKALFVGFSTTMSFFGASDYSTYSTANCFLDAFCKYRLSHGYPNTYCLNWSMWENTGMSENSPLSVLFAMQESGFASIHPIRGLNSLKIALRFDPEQYFIGLNEKKQNIRQYINRYPSKQQEFNVLFNTKETVKQVKKEIQKEILNTLYNSIKINSQNVNLYFCESLPEKKQITPNEYSFYHKKNNVNRKIENEKQILTDTQARVIKLWRDIIGVGNINIYESFFEIGGNSLMAINLVSNIQREFNIDIKVGDVFEKSTVKEMCDFIDNSPRKYNYQEIIPVSKKPYYNASSAQKRMFILNQMEENGISYNIPVFRIFEGKLDEKLFKQSFQYLVDRHEALRTSFKIIDNEIVQIISDKLEFKVDITESDECSIDEIIKKFIRPFELNNAPLLRISLVKFSDCKYLFMFDMHHIISDGVSINILVKEFLALYCNKKLQPLKFQYKDFSEWQNNLFKTNYLHSQENYWLETFSGELPVLHLPTDYSRPPLQQFHGDRVTMDLDNNLYVKLKEIAVKNNTTLYMVLISAFYILLHKYTGQKDIIIGTPTAGRPKADLDKIIGMFINTVVMRNYPDGPKSFINFLNEVKETSLRAFENQDYQYEMLVEKLNLKKDQSRNPLFDIFFAFENMDLTEIELKDVKVTPYDYQNTMSKFDMILFSFLKKNHIVFELEFNTSLFKKTTVKRMLSHYLNIIRHIVEDENVLIAKLNFLSEEEQKQILYEYNETSKDYAIDKTIHHYFEEQVLKTPDSIAVISGCKSLTYMELNENANKLARYLIKKKRNSEQKIAGILMDKSLDAVISLLAVLKAGWAYMPLGIDHPPERISYMIQNSGATVILTDQQYLKNRKFTQLMNLELVSDKITKTKIRRHIKNFDELPIVDRSLIDVSKYKNSISMASTYNCISLQTTRGCPYKCIFCHKVWSKNHVYRSAENIYNEIENYFKQGVKNFSILDDCFNLNMQNGKRLFNLLKKNKIDINIFFPNGLRGDILSKDYIDLMVDAGVVNINLSLETASPRLQKVIKKDLNLEKFRENVDYIALNHSNVILELATMHGFPTETEDEALLTLEFIKNTKWLHFPYIHILKIYPNTEIEKLALENGVKIEDINNSVNLAYHQIPDTLPFKKSFTRQYQADFYNNYFLSKERLDHVLPVQLKLLPEETLVQKYNTYLPNKIDSIKELCDIAGIKYPEVPEKICFDRPCEYFNKKSILKPLAYKAKKILFLDISQHFSTYEMLYKVVEQPLGLLYLLTYIKNRFGDKIDGRILKSGIDFDNFKKLYELVAEYKPDLICIRTLSLYKDFFHTNVALLKSWFNDIPIISGGPYATSEYPNILKDKNVDLVVIGEGEYTLGDLIDEMLKNEFKIPDRNILNSIDGIAFNEGNEKSKVPDILVVDELISALESESTENLQIETKSSDLCYVMYTSGSTGKPKGVMIEHRNVNNCIFWMKDEFEITDKDVILQRTNLTFDPSVWEIFLPLYTGGKVKLITTDQGKDALYLIEMIKKENDITMMYCPASLVSGLLYILKSQNSPENHLKIRWLLIGAESISMEVLNSFYSYIDGNIVNTYGPTETTINNTYYHVMKNGKEKVLPIGRPVANNQIYILSEELQPVPYNVSGEICISGKSIGRGYINNKDETDKLFLRNPFGMERLYKTGDIGRWRENGIIEILGRVDNQEKIRGYRIELGEIESTLSKYEDINASVVTIKDYRSLNTERVCKKCGINSSYPGVKIDIENVCEICNDEENSYEIIEKYFKDLDSLKNLIIDKNRIKKSKYDCILLYGGGQGAAYALYKLVDMGFEVLALTFNNGFLSKKSISDIKLVTGKLGVDHVVLHHKNMKDILKASMESSYHVCKGCFYTSSSMAIEYAVKHDVNIVIGATMSRGQIIENKLYKIVKQGITNLEDIEKEIDNVQKLTYDMNARIYEYINIPEIRDEKIRTKIATVDFYRYEKISNEEMIAYLIEKDEFWKSKEKYAIYSTKCPIKQIGDKIFLNKNKYHYYGNATSWEKRIGHLSLDNVKDDVKCTISLNAAKRFLKLYQCQTPIHKEEIENTYSKILCAYITLKDKKKDFSISNCKRFLQNMIPDYMVPGYYVVMDKFPLTPEGKIDNKLLPEPEINFQKSIFVAPRNEVEKSIIDVWEEILGVQNIGITDNFFDLGGDSIKAIQVSAHLQRKQLKIEIKDLFLNPTIENLSSFVTECKAIDQKEISGEYSLSPIQRWFFSNITKNIHHWNQSVMLFNKVQLEKKGIEMVLEKLIAHHDILRTEFSSDKSGDSSIFSASIKKMEHFKNVEIEVVDIKNENDNVQKIEETANRLHHKMDIYRSPLIKVCLFKANEGDYLLFIMHHLIVDGVSWRILIEDFCRGYKQYCANEKVEFYQKTNSYIEWVNSLINYSESTSISNELHVWKNIDDFEQKPLSRETKKEYRYQFEKQVLKINLSENETKALTKEVNQAYNTTVEDILLVALGKAVKEWSGISKIKINLERHGRNSFDSKIDMSRTVGWFTSMFPVLLNIEDTNISEIIVSVKEQIRTIPNNGIGYNILKYMPTGSNNEKYRNKLKPEISFNFLGQIDNIKLDGGFELSTKLYGDALGRENELNFAIDINGMILQNKLLLEFNYSNIEFSKESIESLSTLFNENIKALISHCLKKEQKTKTMSDVGFGNISNEEYKSLQLRLLPNKIEKFCPLLPMQASMLYQSLLKNDVQLFFQQIEFIIKGNFDIKIFEKALDSLSKRHEVLRTLIIQNEISEPIQVVLNNKKVKLQFVDFSLLNKEQLDTKISELRQMDREKGISLNSNDLLRVAVIKISMSVTNVMFSFHHILMDGWCISLIFSDLFQIYENLKNNVDINAYSGGSYHEYIKWFINRDMRSSSKYWDDYLKSYQRKSLLSDYEYISQEKYEQELSTLVIDQKISIKLLEMAKKIKVTPNSIFQAIWSILLRRYTGLDDIVFGAVVSGRPSELPGVDKTIGLFINTIPVRVQFSEGQSFIKTACNIQMNAIESKQHEIYPLSKIQSNYKGELLFDHIIIFENYPLSEEIKRSQNGKEFYGFNLMEFNAFERINYNLNITVIFERELLIRFNYNKNIFTDDLISIIKEDLKAIVMSVVKWPEIDIKKIEFNTNIVCNKQSEFEVDFDF